MLCLYIKVLDARDPDGTRCRQIEKYLKKEKTHKHLLFVLNKCDLVPTWVTVSASCLIYFLNQAMLTVVKLSSTCVFRWQNGMM